jgi:peptidoglycan/LPS O-acetylase OafA/YrhL
MVQNFAGQPNIIGASWTLAFEMAFYIGCSLLLLTGLHRQSASLAGILLVAGALGATIVPSYFLIGPGGSNVNEKRLAATVLCVLAVAAVGIRCAPRRRRTQLSIVACSAVLVPLVLNRGESWWFALLMFGAMFTGTTLFRWHREQLSGWIAGGVVSLSVLAFSTGAYLNVEDRIDPSVANAHHTWRPEALTFTLAVGLFCAGLGLRHRTFPRWMTYLGAISYSVYLAHAVVIHVVPEIGNRATTLVLWIAVVIGVSAITYRVIEMPFQAVGQRRAARITGPAPASPTQPLG